MDVPRGAVCSRRARALLLGASLGVSAGACMATDAPSAEGPGPLVMAADVGYAPHVMTLPDGTHEGFNVDLGAEIARRLGRPGIEIVDQEFSGVFAGLNARRFEMIIAPTTMTRERSEQVLFTEGYLDTDFTFLIRADAPEITSLEQLRGKAIAVNNGSAYELWALDNQAQYGFEIQRYGKNADAIQAVLTGRAFANLAGQTASMWAAQENPQVRTSWTIRTGTEFSMAFRHEDVAIRNQVEEIVECLKLDGTLARLHETWFREPPAPGSTILTPAPGWGEEGMVGFDPAPHTPRCNPPAP